MDLIALKTLHRSEVVEKATKPGEKDKLKRTMTAPGERIGLNEKEAAALIKSGAVRKLTEEDGSSAKARRSTPASGGTAAPDPDRVADRSMAGENVQGRQDDSKAGDLLGDQMGGGQGGQQGGENQQK